MVLFNTPILFVGSGKITANTASIFFDDTYLTNPLALSDAGHTGLDGRFVNSSIVGALNELKDNVVGTSGSISSASRVVGYVTGISTSAFVHNITHSLGTFDVTVDMYNFDPSGFPGTARPVIVNYSPTSANAVRVELDASASGFFIVTGFKQRVI
jgi:hypothetical protein